MPNADSAYQFFDLVAYGERHGDLRYPQLDADCVGGFVREPGDGAGFRNFTVSSLCITPLKSRTSFLSVTDVRLSCSLTDSRLVVLDRSWSRSGVRVGGGLAYVSATAHAFEEKRSTRPEWKRAAAMHIRLPWLTHLGAGGKLSSLHNEILRMVIKVEGQHYRIDLTPAEDAAPLANDILQRTVRLWTTWDLPHGAALGFEERTKLEALGRRVFAPVPRAPLEVAAFPCNAPVTQHACRAFLEAARSGAPVPD